MMQIGITDHLEGPADRRSREIYDEVADLVKLADSLGVRYAWFAEHHNHAHHGHLPAPLVFALHLAGQTRDLHLGTAVICLNLHHARAVAEQVVVADALTSGRMAVGFGSGSTGEECALFGVEDPDEPTRHARFAESLATVLETWWGDSLPRASPDLAARCWCAVNSHGAARIAGQFNLNVLFSHLRTPAQHRDYAAAYRAAGGTRLLAMNRPVYVGADDASAWRTAGPAVRTLWHRFRAEGKIAPAVDEPRTASEWCAHPLNFLVGGPQTVARGLMRLHNDAPFDVLNVELRWPVLDHDDIRASLERLMQNVVPALGGVT